MAGDEPDLDLVGKTRYTYSEALKYMKYENSKPTDIYCSPTRWVNVETGSEVYINVNS